MEKNALRYMDGLVHELNQAKRFIIKKILDLPENPEIDPNADALSFTVNYKAIVSNDSILSAEYYLWKYQHKKIADKLELTPAEEMRKTLGSMIEKKSFKLGATSIKLHKGVVEQLKQFI